MIMRGPYPIQSPSFVKPWATWISDGNLSERAKASASANPIIPAGSDCGGRRKPAILWTAPRPEQEGIHVRLCLMTVMALPWGTRRSAGCASTCVDLDDGMVRYLMAQQALPELTGKIESLTCPHCGDAHFDQGEIAFEPHGEHTCEQCGGAFRAPGRRRLSVATPCSQLWSACIAARRT